MSSDPTRQEQVAATRDDLTQPRWQTYREIGQSSDDYMKSEIAGALATASYDVEQLSARLAVATKALEQYADYRHWGIERDQRRHATVVWIGPTADATVPDPGGIARSALAELAGEPE